MFICHKNSPSAGRTWLLTGLDTKIARQPASYSCNHICIPMRKNAIVVLKNTTPGYKIRRHSSNA
nr:MAG TPA: hypothetical protein [Caudoviricetes sp.]